MTTKLTLTIDDSVIDSAKKYARSEGKSLSDIVENYLKSITMWEDADENLSPNVRDLMGSVRLPEDFDYKRELGNALNEKYR